jgi:hypothetical protein
MVSAGVDILITHAYLAPLDQKQWKSGRLYPPLATLQAAAVLREQGRHVVFHDMMFSEKRKIFYRKSGNTSPVTLSFMMIISTI